MEDRSVNQVKCPHCEDGIVWIKNDSKESSMYRCPYCEEGRQFLVQDLPLLPRAVLSSSNKPVQSPDGLH